MDFHLEVLYFSKTGEQRPRKERMLSRNWEPRRGKELPTKAVVGAFRRPKPPIATPKYAKVTRGKRNVWGIDNG